MRLYKIIRNRLKISAWKMKNYLGEGSIQAYLRKEREGKRILISDLVKLRALFDGSDAEFLDLIRKCGDK